MQTRTMFSIGYIAAQTGISAHTLRKWEQRYGFPSPKRSSSGTRTYSQSDLQVLSEAKRFIDQGFKPAELFASGSFLFKGNKNRGKGKPNKSELNSHINTLYTLAKAKDFANLAKKLDKLLINKGVNCFIEEYAAPLMRLIGIKWAEKEIRVFEEHSVTATMQQLLNSIIQKTRFDVQSPIILMCTVPNEWHTLGLSMAEAAFSNAGARCVNFNGSLPTAEILIAAKEYDADIVAVSLSNYSVNKSTKEYLDDLRHQLPDSIDLWIGGSGAEKIPVTEQNILAFNNIDQPTQIIKAINHDHTEVSLS